MFRLFTTIFVLFIFGTSLTINKQRHTTLSVKTQKDCANKSIQPNAPGDLDMSLLDPNDNCNGGTLVLNNTVYSNKPLGFQITLPAGWYIPDLNDGDPHFYDCPTYDCLEGFEIENADDLLSEGPEALANRMKADGYLPIYLNDLITNAVVLRSNGSAPGWAVDYAVFFEDRAYAISTSSQDLERFVLSTFVPIPR